MSADPHRTDDASRDASWPFAARRICALTGARRLAAMAALGAVAASAQPPVDLWFAPFLALPPAFWLWRAAPARGGAFGLGWAFGAGYFGFALHWIVEPFLVDAARHGWLAPFALLALAGGLALFWGAAFWAARRWRDRCGGSALGDAAALAAAWSIAEFARSYVLTGFPWALPAYGWIETPASQSAALVGPYAMTLVTLFLGCLAGVRRIGPVAAAGPVAAFLIVAVAWVWGEARISGAAAADGPMIRIVQTNVRQQDKWLPSNVRANFEALLELTSRPADRPPVVVIWPESAVTFPIDMAAEARAEIAARAKGATVALGSLRLDGGPSAPISEASRWRNSVFLVAPDGALSTPFDKIHLVPFGEYLPLESTLSSIGVDALAGLGGGLVAGDAPLIMRPSGAPPVAPLICYEMLFPRETARAATGADWMLLATNDAWFGGWAGPAQHAAMARMRAIETGLPIARSANVGVSSMIDPYGRQLGALGSGRSGVIDQALPDSLRSTPYRDIGEVATAFALCIIIPLATLGGLKRRRR